MQNHVRGLSLIGLLFALAIVTVLSTIALPAWQPLVRQQEGRRVMQGLVSLVNNARSAAIRENTTVTICPAAPGTLTCGRSWRHGAIAFIDPRRRRAPAAETLVHRLQWPADRGQLRWRAFGNRQYLVINSRGQLLHQNGNFTWCPPDGNPHEARQLVINSTGRLRHARDNDGDGIREDSALQPLSCR